MIPFWQFMKGETIWNKLLITELLSSGNKSAG